LVGVPGVCVRWFAFPIADALGYALNSLAALVRYTEAGFLTIDNYVSERGMKRIW
jgi:hypothetical protein